MNKLRVAAYHAAKVGLHITLAIFVTGPIVYVQKDPSLIVFAPVVNIITAGIIKYFSLEIPDLTIDQAHDNDDL